MQWPASRRGPRPRAELLPGLLPGLLVVLVLGLLVGCAAPESTVRPTSPSATIPRDPLGVLQDWDEARAAAWAGGDAEALAALYLPGSRAGLRDVRSLRAYAVRGLRVSGIHLQRLAARVLVRDEALLRVEVVERVLSAAVDDGAVVRRLPAGQPSRRVVELRYVDGAWLVGTVRPVRR